MKARNDFDYNLISSFLDYNSEIGSLKWKKSVGKAKAGSEAGSVGVNGYIKVTLLGRCYIAHRLAWCLFYRQTPPNVVDHINHKKTDNRICNLRDGTNSINQQNQCEPHSRNKSSKYIGVSKLRGKWRAKIYHAGSYYFLGYHLTEEQARDAYIEAKRKIHTGCSI